MLGTWRVELLVVALFLIWNLCDSCLATAKMILCQAVWQPASCICSVQKYSSNSVAFCFWVTNYVDPL